MRPVDSDAAALLAIADRLSRLPAYNARNPHAFHEGKSELAAEIRAIAHKSTGRVVKPAKPRRPGIETIEQPDGRRVVVQVKRPAFAVG